MSSLTVDRFEVGVDLRKGPHVSDANRLRSCTNAYISNGRAIQKRPGLSHVQALALDSGGTNATRGLFGAKGKLNTFSNVQATPAAHGGSIVVDNILDADTGGVFDGTVLSKVWYATVLGGYYWVLAENTAGRVDGFWLDGAGGAAGNEVVHASFPYNLGTPPSFHAAAKLAERIFVTNGEVIQFSSLADGKAWDLVGGAADGGTIAAGRNALGADAVQALGQYQGDLIALFEDSAQSWDVDADITLNFFQQSIDGVGSSLPRTVDNLAGDTFFLSTSGFRSISLLSLTNNLADVDVGTAIESLVKGSGIDAYEAQSVYNPAGQYMCYVYPGSGAVTPIWVYSFSRTSKISAWSKYNLDIIITDITTLGSEVYVRDNTSPGNVFKLDPTLFQDEDSAGTPTNFGVEIIMAFLDFKKPGDLKYIKAVDVVLEGECDLSFLYKYWAPAWKTGRTYAVGEYVRPRLALNGRRYKTAIAGGGGDTEPIWETVVGGTQTTATGGSAVWDTEYDGELEAESAVTTVYSNTRPGELIPVEIVATSIAPKIVNNTDRDFRLDAITLYWENLGVMS